MFCSNISDGKIVALGNNNARQLLGTDASTLKDATGKPFGAELVTGERKPEGEITEVQLHVSPARRPTRRRFPGRAS